VYVVNSLDDSVSVIDANAREVIDTLTGKFSQPYHLATTPVTGKVYAANFGNNSVTVLKGGAVVKVVDLYDSAQPYGIAVDEHRNLVYVATVATNRIVAIGTLHGQPDQFLGWAAFYRGFGNRNRPVPLRAIAVNQYLGPEGDGGHIWSTTSTADGSEQNQALLIPKGWTSYFHYPLAQTVGENPGQGIAIDHLTNRVYVSSGTWPGIVTVIGDQANLCPGVGPASTTDGTTEFDFDLFVRAAQSSGDVTGDGQVDILDLAFIAARFKSTDPTADVNGDGQVDILDLATAAQNYGQVVIVID
jgi:YVTN family beta-propeller protein